MIGQFHILLESGVQVGFAPFAFAAPGMFEHAAHDIVGALAVIANLVQALAQIFRDFADVFPGVRFLYFLKQFLDFLAELHGYFGKVADEIERILDFVGNTRRQLAQRCQFLFGDDLLLRLFQFLQGRFQTFVLGVEFLRQFFHQVEPLHFQGILAEFFQRFGHVGNFVVAADVDSDFKVAPGHFAHRAGKRRQSPRQ